MGKTLSMFQGVPFHVSYVDDDGSLAYFEDDEAFLSGASATHFITLVSHPLARAIVVTKVLYYVNPTAAETYQLYLLQDNANSVYSESVNLIYASEALRADSVLYIETGNGGTKLPMSAYLDDPGIIWLKVDWTGAPGNTPGALYIEGMVYV